MEEKRNTSWVRKFGRKQGIAVLVLMALLFGGFGITQYYKNVRLSRQVENGYRHALTELVDYVNNIDTTLAKAMVTNNQNQLMMLSTDLWRESAFAKANLGQLPVSNTELDNTANFLTQVGDYAYSLSHKMMNGQQLSDREMSQLASLSNHAAGLSETLQNMEHIMLNGALNFDVASRSLGDNVQVFGSNMQEVEKKFSDYVSLIYDGPFSQHIMNKEPVMTKGAKEISEEQAKAIAKKFTGAAQVKSVSVSEGSMPTFDCVLATDEEGREITVEVTKFGGYVRMLLDNKLVHDSRIDIATAGKKAGEFLTKHGFYDMKQTGYVLNGNSVDFAFAYTQNGYTMYGDLIKVQIALDDGAVIGFEAHGYYTNHIAQRPLPQENITPEQARDMMKPGLSIQGVNRCQIPLESGQDVYCYEVKVTHNDRTFLVYINVENGREEKILMLVESDAGALTI